MEVKKEVETSDYIVGVIMARFQVHKLHEAKKKLIDTVCANHKKVIIFLGVPIISNTKSNPLDFATRKAMIQEMYPDVVILPQKDQRSDEKWSQNLDSQITIPFGEGQDDDFIIIKNNIKTQMSIMPLSLKNDNNHNYPASDEIMVIKGVLLKEYAPNKK